VKWPWSVALSGTQRHSEVISGHQRSSAVISGHQRSSAVISGHQRRTPSTWLVELADGGEGRLPERHSGTTLIRIVPSSASSPSGNGFTVTRFLVFTAVFTAAVTAPVARVARGASMHASLTVHAVNHRAVTSVHAFNHRAVTSAISATRRDCLRRRGSIHSSARASALAYCTRT
jgi:hypothetical protein